jgi:hypothetical protein
MGDLTLYYKYREQMRTGDSLLYKTDGKIPSMIRWFTEFNHAGLVLHFEDNFNNSMPESCDRVWTFEAGASGVKSVYLSDKLGDTHGKVYWYPLKDEFSYAQRMLVSEYASMQRGTKYDFSSLFRNILGRVSANAREFFCSELNYLAYVYARMIPEIDKAPRPGDIPKFNIFKEPVLILG